MLLLIVIGSNICKIHCFEFCNETNYISSVFSLFDYSNFHAYKLSTFLKNIGSIVLLKVEMLLRGTLYEIFAKSNIQFIYA